LNLLEETMSDTQLLDSLKEVTKLLEDWWTAAGSPVHSTELALADAKRLIEQAEK
jgi:hypothetical protein